MPLLTFNENGIYCAQADVYIDPWKPVKKAVITHAHADHARPGSGSYLAHKDSVPIMRYRLGDQIRVEGADYGQAKNINGVVISLHPAGHIAGSAQVRVAYKGEIWVVSGDFKLQPDPYARGFEPVPCHHFITESTFGLPVYRWPEPEKVFSEIRRWWHTNREQDRVSVLGAYSLGKAQRILAGLAGAEGPVFTHGAVENSNEVLRRQGFNVPETIRITPEHNRSDLAGSLVICPPSAIGTSWMRKLGKVSTGFCSGWMLLRGTRRRRAADRGFVISDHADWSGLNEAVIATGAENIYVTHGYKDIFARWLREQYGLNASDVDTLYEGESLEGDGV
jgi:putative mRNA 3-end processing factor